MRLSRIRGRRPQVLTVDMAPTCRARGCTAIYGRMDVLGPARSRRQRPAWRRAGSKLQTTRGSPLHAECAGIRTEDGIRPLPARRRSPGRIGRALRSQKTDSAPTSLNGGTTAPRSRRNRAQRADGRHRAHAAARQDAIAGIKKTPAKNIGDLGRSWIPRSSSRAERVGRVEARDQRADARSPSGDRLDHTYPCGQEDATIGRQRRAAIVFAARMMCACRRNARTVAGHCGVLARHSRRRLAGQPSGPDECRPPPRPATADRHHPTRHRLTRNPGTRFGIEEPATQCVAVEIARADASSVKRAPTPFEE